MSQALQHILNSPLQITLIWVVVALLVVLFIVFRPRRILITSSADGRLQISRRALHRLIETCCEQLKGVASARARVTGPAGKFKTRICLKIRPDARLDAIQGYLKQEVAEIYRQNLGIVNEGSVEVEVTGVIAEDKPL